ncbi:hypothetical protein CC85DRAFT_325945 [Cutaneotrichosporon oleaginosum]|uniref:Beta-glucuronidase C-terminal domain-containing protein n=1 Tax=Cutaneotrichosporon oleaginosum TaxID=879819 RepID=A0A0J0XVD7_9TREE|nr:uncharacterized protein CC85DRAFT_325945 [Cutaneotrichosporon oleaginosum]KLT45026.1 hypothetical protein CC85DRAFT_325945 [Cutaneotrichosporon oleaginosum]TXT09713.1 hypothetical protein COLE_03647 [Cutaneotrichosporon oleaginosum]
MLIQVLLAPLLAPVLALTLYNGKDTHTDVPTVSVVVDAPPPVYTGLRAYDPTRLVPPPPPQPPTTQVTIGIPNSPNTQGYPLSIKQRGNFLGFSIELSIATSVMGLSPQRIKPSFLNYMANIRNRAGVGPIIRVGGNTQDRSSLFVNGLPEGGSLQKVKDNSPNMPTKTPIVSYSLDLLYTLANISSLVDAKWYFGLAFNQSNAASISDNMPIAAGYAQKILGSHLRGLALGNEPDLYLRHGKRPQPWGMVDYINEFNTARTKIMGNPDVTNHQTLLGPSVCCRVDGFDLPDVLGTTWLNENIDYLAAVTVQRYPANNCQINGRVIDPQAIFPNFLNHTGVQALTAEYLAGSAIAQARGKEMLMLEFNTASCGGFPGLSDSFGAAMWIADWAFQLAWGNFSTALLHVGGQNVYYNPFTPPPFDGVGKQWTTGTTYYSTLIVAEAFGRTGTAQVVDLLPDGGDMFHPAYVVYENSAPARVVLFNYVSDPSGASTYNAVISLSDLVRVAPPPPPTPPVTDASPSTPDDGTAEPADDPVVPVANPAPGASDATTPAASEPAPAPAPASTPAASDPASTPPAADPNAQSPPVKRATLPSSVFVRYFRAPTVSEQYNITWAGQTLGYSFASDGRLYGATETQEFACHNGECVVPVPAPAIAIVYLSPDALYESTPEPQATQTYATTAQPFGTFSIDFMGAMATGNGWWPGDSIYGAASRTQVQVSVGLLAVALTTAYMLVRL